MSTSTLGWIEDGNDYAVEVDNSAGVVERIREVLKENEMGFVSSAGFRPHGELAMYEGTRRLKRSRIADDGSAIVLFPNQPTKQIKFKDDDRGAAGTALTVNSDGDVTFTDFQTPLNDLSLSVFNLQTANTNVSTNVSNLQTVVNDLSYDVTSLQTQLNNVADLASSDNANVAASIVDLQNVVGEWDPRTQHTSQITTTTDYVRETHFDPVARTVSNVIGPWNFRKETIQTTTNASGSLTEVRTFTPQTITAVTNEIVESTVSLATDVNNLDLAQVELSSKIGDWEYSTPSVTRTVYGTETYTIQDPLYPEDPTKTIEMTRPTERLIIVEPGGTSKTVAELVAELDDRLRDVEALLDDSGNEAKDQILDEFGNLTEETTETLATTGLAAGEVLKSGSVYDNVFKRILQPDGTWVAVGAIGVATTASIVAGSAYRNSDVLKRNVGNWDATSEVYGNRTMTTAVSEHDAALQTMSETVTQHDTTLNTLNTSLVTTQTDVSTLEKNVGDWNSDVLPFASDVTPPVVEGQPPPAPVIEPRTMTEAVIQHDTALNTLNTSLDTLQTDVNQHGTTLNTLNTSLDTLQADVATMQTNVATLQTLEANVGVWDRTVQPYATTATQPRTMTTAVTQHDTTLNTLQTELKTLQDQVTANASASSVVKRVGMYKQWGDTVIANDPSPPIELHAWIHKIGPITTITLRATLFQLSTQRQGWEFAPYFNANWNTATPTSGGIATEERPLSVDGVKYMDGLNGSNDLPRDTGDGNWWSGHKDHYTWSVDVQYSSSAVNLDQSVKVRCVVFMNRATMFLLLVRADWGFFASNYYVLIPTFTISFGNSTIVQ